MKLQMAWNPVSKKRKKVAKRRKKLKTKSVKRKNRKVQPMAKKRRKKSSAFKFKSKKRSHRKSRRRKNPEAAVIRKGGKVVSRGFSSLNKAEANKVQGLMKQARQEYDRAPKASSERSAAFKRLLALTKKLEGRKAYDKLVARYKEEGADVKEYNISSRGGKSVATKRGGKKSGKKGGKKSGKKAGRKTVKRGKKGKGGKKPRRSKAQKAALRKMLAAAKAARKAKKGGKKTKRGRKKGKGRKGRRRSRMVTHRHAKSTRHFKKGSSLTFKTKVKRRKGRPGATITGRVKFNPFRRNPMKQVSAQMKKALGLDAAELTSLALGGAMVPIVNAGISKIPGAGAIVSKINSFVGPQAAGSVIPILVGAIINIAADKASGQAKDYGHKIGEGLVAAGVLGLAMGISQKYIAPALGLSGVRYTPNMRGMGILPQLSGMGDVRFTPNMRGMGDIRYTPSMSGGADFGAADYGGGGGYTEAHKRSRADFGANFSEDSEAEGLEDQDNSYSSSMN